jgi:phosphohistidine phosphatase
MRRVACGLKRFVQPPDGVLSSPLVRAKQTAAVLSREAGWPEAGLHVALSPGQPLHRAFALIARQRVERVAVVGHEPAMSALLAACIAGGGKAVRLRFRKGAVACVSFDGKVAPGRGQLSWFAPPRALGMLGR